MTKDCHEKWHREEVYKQGQACHGGGAWTFTVKNGNIKECEVIHSKYNVWYCTIHTS